MLGRPVSLLPTPAEELTLRSSVDTLVMISILQSVHDVLATLQASTERKTQTEWILGRRRRDHPAARQAAYNALRPGGIIVFSDRVFDGRWDEHISGGDPFWDVGQ